MPMLRRRPHAIVLKTMVTHTVTYFVAGVTAYVLFDYPTLIAESALGRSMRPMDDPLVMAGPLFQPLRGLLFGLVCSLLRQPFFDQPRGWLTMWIVLMALGIVGTFAAPPGSLEGVIYTTLPVSLHLTLLPELLAQSLMLSWILFHWVTATRRWLTWTMWAAFAVVLLLPALGLLTTVQR